MTIVSHWSFDEISGVTAVDTGILLKNLTLVNNPIWVTGHNGNALQFNGTSQYGYNTSAALIPSTYPFSISFWINPTDLSNLSWNDIFRNTDSWAVQANSFGQLSFEITSQIDVLSGVTLQLSTWTHVVVVCTSTQIEFYINGSSASIIPNTLVPNTSSGSIYVGGYPLWATYNNSSIDELKIYDTALTPSEVLVEYNSGSSTGSISCSTTPQGASISLDGINQGVVTPYTIQNVSAGNHTVSFGLVGYQPCSQLVTVSINSTSTASCNLTPIVTTGNISCSTTPLGANVYLDGTNQGVVTPTTLNNISTGSHTVTYTLTGYNQCSVVVNVTAGLTSTASCSLVPIVTTGNISCSTTPSGASINLDGTNIGVVTPYTLTNISVGSHTLIYTLSGYNQCSVPINVIAGSTVTASCTLTPTVTTGSISCSTTPSGASISLDGVLQGVTTPYTLTNINSGSHIVIYNLTGYNSCQVTVNVSAGTTTTASCTLTPLVTTGSILCTTNPTGASISLDGISQGVNTQYTLTNISVGNHTVTYNLSGYQQCSQSVSVVAGSTTTASCTLVPIATTGNISCTTNPLGASIALDGISQGVITPYTLTNIQTGNHNITFTLAGYNSCQVSSTVIAGSTITASCTLTPIVVIGTVGYWNFNENGGGIVNDSSGNNNDGTIYPLGINNWTTGIEGSAFNWLWGTEYVDIGNNPSLNISGDMTIEAWIKPSSLSYSLMPIFVKSDSTGYSYYFATGTLYGNTISFQLGGVGEIQNGSQQIILNQWNHVVGVRGGNTMKTFINGMLSNNITSLSGNIYTSTRNAIIGRDYGFNSFRGVIDEVVVYNKALTDSEVLSRYNRFSTCNVITATLVLL